MAFLINNGLFHYFMRQYLIVMMMTLVMFSASLSGCIGGDEDGGDESEIDLIIYYDTTFGTIQESVQNGNHYTKIFIDKYGLENTLIVSADKNEMLSKPSIIIRKLSDVQIQCKAVSSLEKGLEIVKSLVNNSPSIGLIFGSHYIAEEVFHSFEISFDNYYI